MRPYKQRPGEDSEPLRRSLGSTYPDGEKRSAVFSDISQAITAYQEVYFEIGLIWGAKIAFQLCERMEELK